jgi:hypothetical protein
VCFLIHKNCLVKLLEPDEPPIPMRGHSPTFITKWVDYSVKYGFGFQLTDGSVGVLFPDTTRMLLTADDRYDGQIRYFLLLCSATLYNLQQIFKHTSVVYSCVAFTSTNLLGHSA